MEIVRREREARATAEAETAAAKAEADALREQLADLASASNAAQTQITTLNQERDTVRARVEGRCCSRWTNWYSRKGSNGKQPQSRTE